MSEETAEHKAIRMYLKGPILEDAHELFERVKDVHPYKYAKDFRDFVRIVLGEHLAALLETYRE